MALKDPILTVFNFGGYGGLQRSDFLLVSTLGGCCGHEKTDFNNFSFRRVQWS